MADDSRTYTEAEHLALMADAVKRENASVTDAKETAETKLSEATARVDVLEGEKTALEAEKAQIQTDFDAYKAEIERAREVETRKQERTDAVKAANDKLPDAYFTDERVQAWAEMADETFALVVDGLKALAATSTETKETAAFSGGESPASPKPSTGSFLAARRGREN